MMAFLRRNYLWPVWRRDMDTSQRLGRLRWVLWRWWTWELRKRYRQGHCQEHDPISFRVGRLMDFQNGGPAQQRVMCAYCGVTIRDFRGPLGRAG